ncbi:otu-like cysteine protease family protein [Pyrenophora tritici-repentis]|nr:otu-like cysteine protease family protein [Pyrenophora tritici-repentis]KAI0582822.1 otu-like cysteine protease family protein [Pyrenophora tritici-repentis]KAI0609830.1 otu-like cysteine protease family protein [Pyrenophora tritici-repentis]PZC93018.1 OTU domain containing protein [Pyrenophora tritici-repentis]PZD38283.1 OTU domain containing protein [Pyrenophora tritici-repentis]
MTTRRQRANSPEFPILDANSLYASTIRGDGNCLFNALSDQLCGDQGLNQKLRAATIEHMKENADFYRQYMAVNNVRRNPKRKTAAAAKRVDNNFYTDEQLQVQFEEHVEKMGQPGEWADNMEVSAFASALNVHVRLWQHDYTYLFSPRDYYSSNEHLAGEDTRQTLHIAYHTWEHYSSVRNIAGPHTGLPNVNVVPKVVSKKRPSPSVDGDDDDQGRRSRKRRSPLPLFDSDSTPEGTAESSSDESNGFAASQQSKIEMPLPEPVKPQKLTIKLRCLRTSDVASPASSRPSSRAATPAPLAQSSESKKTTKVAPTPTKTTICITPKKPVSAVSSIPTSASKALVVSPVLTTPKKSVSVASPTPAMAETTPKPALTQQAESLSHMRNTGSLTTIERTHFQFFHG